MEETLAILSVVIGLPWLILHYITKWKSAPKLTDGDEQMLEELFQLARRLDARMDTVERLVVADSPEFGRVGTDGPRLIADSADDNDTLAEIERKLKERTAR
ncbi:envelope stress response membrane protein PspB [Croceicoccus ponticola]|uniref:Envelope stress response membrane protein PspB n=1 Tax=Croceicoccus ponticola TaxID=2217664 RepID=A0A437GU98_9SPHN|nr:envelope stress response membrane protein PspB [Croceicoccus ponticola]RVQ64874.1 envelope stress response membrane protein PspB [Croceicoccus ponticola]